jgi:hypothetical protein
MPAHLTYYIVEGLLVGVCGDQVFHILALSGGAGGSTQQSGSDAVNNPYMEALKTKGKPHSQGHVHGGPLPPGIYVVHTPAHHPHLGLSARLDHPRFRPMGRDGFYIHGRGPHGSDGCIVPLDKTEFSNLMKALTKSHGGTLVVEETADGTRYA